MRHLLKDYPQISIRPESLNGHVDFAALFARNAAVHIEIGSGRGAFLLSEAINFPKINFLGIEWASRFYRYSVDRMGRWNITNVKVIRTEAAWFIEKHIGEKSVDCFHIYFPDPWPKVRHKRRRFFNEANLIQMVRCLKKGGIIQAATDDADYFEQIQNLIEARTDLEKAGFQPAAGTQEGELVGSNFERKYIKDSRPVLTIAAKKIQ
jgi:tRNA (guanine-N7-)-methyltransferase